jgi:hypothetical protein
VRIRFAYLVVLASTGCGAAPLGPAVHAEDETPEQGSPAVEIPQIGAGRDFACALFEDHLSCVGNVPTSGDDTVPSARYEVRADLLAVGNATYCVAHTGEQVVRCHGAFYLDPGDRYDEWYEECHGDEECVAEAEARWTSEPLELHTRTPLLDLEAFADRLCAVSEGELTCWDLTEEDPRATDVSHDRVEGAADVEVGMGMMCLRTDRGAVSCREDWGDELDELTPIEALPSVERIAVEGSFACGWSAYGSAYCWGEYIWPLADELEEAVEVSLYSAARIEQLDGIRELSAGSDALTYFCAIDRGALRCYGAENTGAVLGPTVEGHTEETPIDPGVAGAVHVATGATHACAIDARARLFCWGRADEGALGLERRRTSFGVVEVESVRAYEIAAFGDRSCARTAEGWECWGSTPSGETAPRLPWERQQTSIPRHGRPLHFRGALCTTEGGSLFCGPAREERAPAFRALATTSGCFANERGAVVCVDGNARTELAGVSDVIALAGDSIDLYALSRAGSLEIFRKREGTWQRGDAVDVGRDVEEIAHCIGRTCVRERDGSVRCRLRAGAGFSPLAIPPAAQLVSGVAHICARTRDGEVYCWGSNTNGRLGVAPDASGDVHRVGGLANVVEISAGSSHTCARTTEARVFCWGEDVDGQLGARPSWWNETPVEMELP